MEAYPREGLERKETEVTATSPAKGWAGRNCIAGRVEREGIPQYKSILRRSMSDQILPTPPPAMSEGGSVGRNKKNRTRKRRPVPLYTYVHYDGRLHCRPDRRRP